jgi:DNA-binding transcriptional LysR family regulator
MNLDDLSISEYAARGYEEPGLRHADIGVRPTATAYHMEGIAHLILSGHYLGYLPEHYARYWVKEGRMRPIRPDLTRHQIEIHLIVRKSSRLTPAMQIFRDTLIGAYAASDET